MSNPTRGVVTILVDIWWGFVEWAYELKRCLVAVVNHPPGEKRDTLANQVELDKKKISTTGAPSRGAA